MMIKFFVSLLLIALLSFAGGLFLPWWIIVVVAFAVSALIPMKPFPSFLAGFLALLLLWGGLAAYLDYQNNSILSTRIAQLLGMKGSSVALIVVTAVVGGLVGGGGSLTASFLRAKAK